MACQRGKNPGPLSLESNATPGESNATPESIQEESNAAPEGIQEESNAAADCYKINATKISAALKSFQEVFQPS